MSCNLSYNASITGDCANINSGSFTIDIFGDAPDYTIQWLSPTTGTTALGAGVTTYTQTNLSANTYSFNIIDSCISGNTVQPVNIFISSGTCVSISNINNTVCDSNNGSLTAVTSNFYGNAVFSLYSEVTGLISTSYSSNNLYVFDNLSVGTYYVIADDGGGCTGKSESVIIKNSSTLSFGLYVVDNAGCAVDSGKIYITGLTGTPPYTYLWSNGSNGDSLTGLTEGTYTVTVTDSSYCTISDTAVIYNILPVGLGAIYLTQPTCFTADGEIEIIITGGTAPFYYLGSNGVTDVTFDRTVVFTGLGPGGFTIQVVDAGLCTFTTSTTLLTPKGMSIISVDITNSTCNDLSGVVGPIVVFGGTSPYTFTLTDSLGNQNSNTVYESNWIFNNLSSGNYTLDITDNGNCNFTSAYTINNVITFDLSTLTTGTTCNGKDGSVMLSITSGGTPPYRYEIDGQSIKNVSLTSYTFNNLFSGNYTASVTDSLLCKQIQPFTISESNTVNFHLLSEDSFNNDGLITAYITNGTPPFTLYFNGSTTGTTVMSIPDLPIGDYSVRIVDSSGCSKTKRAPIKGNYNYSSTGYYKVCEGSLNQPMTIYSGPKQYLNEGYDELIMLYPGYTNCNLTGATFSAQTTIGGCVNSTTFYTATTLNDYPSDSLWYSTITALIESCPQIGPGNVTIDPITDTITITTNCEPESLHNSDVLIEMRIDYEIECVCPLPTPTQTPTQTMTMTPTHSPTPTNTATPTPTQCVNVVTNGNFDTDLSGWNNVAPSPWVWSSNYGGSAEATGSDELSWISQNCLTENCEYQITFEVVMNSPSIQFVIVAGADNIIGSLPQGTNVSSTITTSGIYTVNLVCTGSTELQMYTFDGGGSDNVFVKSISACLLNCLTPTPTNTSTPTTTPTITPTTTTTPTTTQTITPTRTPTTTPTPSSKNSYYVYSICGLKPGPENNVIIQPVPAIPGNVIGNVILDLKNKICWELINISTNLASLQNTYLNNSYYSTNYFIFNDGVQLFVGSETLKPCDECIKSIESISTPIDTECFLSLVNYSNCKGADTTGEIYVNGLIIYSFNESFNVNSYLELFEMTNGDVVKIVLNTPLTGGIVTLDVNFNNGENFFSDTASNGGSIIYSYNYKCGSKNDTIAIFSTCDFT